jgi:ubiquinone/menaquinone biosynthesis C-methylase UbiE
MEWFACRIRLNPDGRICHLVNFSDLSIGFSAWLRKKRLKEFLPPLLGMLSPKKEDIILDVGAGTGVIAAELTKFCDEVFALEPDPKRVDFIKKKYPAVKAFDGSAEAIQFPESYFTKILVIGSLHHFSDKDTALYEFQRVLKKQGLLVIRDSEPQKRTSRFETRAAKVNFIGSAELKKKLEETGFEVKEIRKDAGGSYFVSSTKI